MRLSELLRDELPKGKFWTDAWSLVSGCTPVSPGCKNCWLAAMEHRFGKNYDWDRLVEPSGQFNGNIYCHEDRLDKPLRARKPRVYAIWSDLGHEAVPYDFRLKARSVMAISPQHHFVIVTKRPQSFLYDRMMFAPLPNVTILVTMEDQQRADERAPYAMQLAAQGWRVGALCEPLLGPVDLHRIYHHGETEGGGSWDSWDSALNGKTPDIWGDGPDIEGGPRLSWVITGGESGPGTRPAHPDWFRSLRDQAQAAGVPFLFKQWGEWAPCRNDDTDWPGIATDFDLPRCPDSAAVHSWGGHVFSLRAGKKNTGRILDGFEWLEVPE